MDTWRASPFGGGLCAKTHEHGKSYEHLVARPAAIGPGTFARILAHQRSPLAESTSLGGGAQSAHRAARGGLAYDEGRLPSECPWSEPT
jgi:hypothetical protein